MRSKAVMTFVSFCLVSAFWISTVNAGVGLYPEPDTSAYQCLIPEEGYFTRNLGQWAPELEFVGAAPFGHVGLGAGRIYYHIVSPASMEIFHGIAGGKAEGITPHARDEAAGGTVVVLDLRSECGPEGSMMLDHRSNYFYGDDPDSWVAGAPSYRLVEYNGIYEGIDLRMGFDDGNPKYEFVVHPGGDPEDISIGVSGHDSMEIGEELTIRTSAGADIIDKGLFAFTEDGPRVRASFRRDGGSGYGFDIGSYDRTKDLIIDPVVFSTFIGGSGDDISTGSRVDGSGNGYVTGGTLSSNFPTTPGAYDTRLDLVDSYTLKMDPTGSTLLFSTFFGGSDWDVAYGIAMDGSGNSYMTGITYSSDFPTTSNAFNDTHWGDEYVTDLFVLKLNPSGSSLVYSTYVAGNDTEISYDIEVDADGNAHVTGSTYSKEFPTTTGAFDEEHNQFEYYSDVFYFELNRDGSDLLYSTYIGGDDDDTGYCLELDPSGYVYITGSTWSMDFPVTKGAYETEHYGWTDVFVLKLDTASSALSYCTFVGGNDEEEGHGLVLDSSNNAYVTGYTWSNDLPWTPDAYDTSFNGVSIDSYVFKLNPTGSSLLYLTYLGGSEDELSSMFCGIDVDDTGAAHVVGSTYSTDFPTTPKAYRTTKSSSDEYDIYLTILDPTGSDLEYSTYIGGNDEEQANFIGIVEGNDLVLSGFTSSTDFPTTSGSFQQSHAGVEDCFWMKFNLDTSPSNPLNLAGTSGNRYIKLTWDEPSNDGGAPILNYSIYRGTTSGSLDILTTLGPVLEYNDTGLVNGQIYYYQVTATNNVGEGLPSDKVSFTPLTLPDPPDHLDAFRGLNRVELKWKAPLDNGGSPVIEYRIYRGAAPGDLSLLLEVGPSVLSYNDDTAEIGELYYYAVSAVTDLGESGLSNQVGCSTLTVPSMPLNFTLYEGNGYVLLQWSEPEDNGGSALTDFSIYRAKGEMSMVLLKGVDPDVHIYNDTSVSNGQMYHYRISAANIVGESPRTGILDGLPTGLPGAPVNLQAEPGNRMAKLTWEAPEDDGGTPITSYRIYRALGTEDAGMAGEVDGDVLLFEDTGLINNQQYKYHVTAVNGRGESSQSQIVLVLPLGLASKPLSLTIATGDSFIDLGWGTPASDGGAAISGYNVYKGTRSGGEELLKQVSTLVFNDTDVENGLEYFYYVTAINSVGEGPPSSEVSGTPYGLPDAPYDIGISAGNRRVELNWTLPGDDGGSPVTDILIYRSAGQGGWAVIATLDPTDTTYVDEEVDNGVVYYYFLRSRTRIGESGNSDQLSAKPITTSGPVMNLVIERSSGNAMLTWEPPEDTGGVTIDNYKIYRVGPDGERTLLATVGGGATSYIDSTISKDVKYRYSVVAVTEAGEGAGIDNVVDFRIPKDEGGVLGFILFISGLLLLLLVIGVAVVLVFVIKKRKTETQPPTPIMPGQPTLPVDGGVITSPAQQLSAGGQEWQGAYGQLPGYQQQPGAGLPPQQDQQLPPAAYPQQAYSGQQTQAGWYPAGEQPGYEQGGGQSWGYYPPPSGVPEGTAQYGAPAPESDRNTAGGYSYTPPPARTQEQTTGYSEGYYGQVQQQPAEQGYDYPQTAALDPPPVPQASPGTGNTDETTYQ